MTRDQATNVLIERGILAMDYKAQITQMNAQIRRAQMQLADSFDNLLLRKRHKNTINAIRNSLYKLFSTAQCLDAYTLEGYATQYVHHYIIQNSLYRNGRKLKVKFATANRVYNELAFYQEEPREIAKDEEWRAIWGVKRVSAFKYSPLTHAQIMLASFSKMYDSVYKSPEKPNDELIADNDALDGWFHNQNARSNKGGIADKVASKKEVFVMVNNQEEANEVYMSNGAREQAIQSARLKQGVLNVKR